MIGSTLLLAAVMTTAGTSEFADAVHTEARSYRITVYHQLRTRRDEYNQQQEAGWNTFEQWKQSDQGAMASERAIRWFAEARQQLDPQGRALVGMVIVEDDESHRQESPAKASSYVVAPESTPAPDSHPNRDSEITVSPAFPARALPVQSTGMVDLVSSPQVSPSERTVNSRVAEPILGTNRRVPAEADERAWENDESAVDELDEASDPDELGRNGLGMLKGSAPHVLSRVGRAILRGSIRGGR